MSAVPEVARISLKQIVVPTDFSLASAAGMPFAEALSRIYGSTLILAHVVSSEPHRRADRQAAQNDPETQEVRRHAEEFGHRFAPETAHTEIVERGDRSEIIPAIIRERSVDLVVLGTHGRRGVSRVVLGSGAEQIYRSAPCPVMTVGPSARPQNWSLRRILCPVDLAGKCEPALNFALSLAEENAAQFIVLAAVPMVPWQHRASVEEETLRSVENLIPEQAKDWCTPQLLVRWEYPAEAILRTAAEREADLIVIGVHKARAAGLSSHLPWPIASEVVSRAPCPVLTVRV